MGSVTLEVMQHFFAGQLVLREDSFIELELPVGLVEFADSGVRVVNVIHFECAQLKVNKASFRCTDARCALECPDVVEKRGEPLLSFFTGFDANLEVCPFDAEVFGV